MARSILLIILLALTATACNEKSDVSKVATTTSEATPAWATANSEQPKKDVNPYSMIGKTKGEDSAGESKTYISSARVKKVAITLILVAAKVVTG